MNNKLRQTLLSIALSAVLGLLLNAPAMADQVIADDLIVQGSACIGFDCVNGESFGFDTIRLKENNLRIKFQDTSSSGSFPTNDWQLTANDSTNGGANRFSIDDIDGGKTPFTVEAGARTNALVVDSTGRIGIGTNSPVLDIHVKNGNTPGLRLEQDNTSGFTAQTWDVAGNETNFFVRDVTNGSKLPFRIRPGAPTSSIDIAGSGNVGIGTASPGTLSDGSQASLHIKRSNGDASVLVEDTASGVNLMFELKTPDFPFFRLSNNTSNWQLGIGANGFVIDDPATAGDSFEVRSNGDIAVSGTVVHSSDRNMKQDITPINSNGVLEAIAAMDISTWSYKRSPDIRHIGPMAQDFRAAFQLGDGDTTISDVDAQGVALAGIKGLYLKLQQKDEEINELRKRAEGREEMLAQLATRNAALSERVGRLESLGRVEQRLARLEKLLGVPSNELAARLASLEPAGN